jgi:hypothetical protein
MVHNNGMKRSERIGMRSGRKWASETRDPIAAAEEIRGTSGSSSSSADAVASSAAISRLPLPEGRWGGVGRGTALGRGVGLGTARGGVGRERE